MDQTPRSFGRSIAIDTEAARYRGLIERAEAAQRKCRTEKDRDLYEGEIGVWRGLLSALERAAAYGAPQ